MTESNCARAEQRAAGSRFLSGYRTLIAPDSPWLPWLAVAALSAGFWLAEALVHVLVFGSQQGLAAEMFTPGPNELWMRSLVVVLLVVIGFIWARAGAAHREYLARTELYSDRLGDAACRYAYGDTEQRREAAERLHENVGQALAGARLFLASVDADGCDPDSRQALTSVARILDRAIADCRDIAQTLSPPALGGYGLESALETLAKRVSRDTGTQVVIAAADRDTPLHQETSAVAFHVLAEIVEAAAADPATTQLTIETRDEGDSLAVTVSWDGEHSSDFWIERERMTRVGGSVCHATTPAGTTVVVCTPLASAA